MSGVDIGPAADRVVATAVLVGDGARMLAGNGAGLSLAGTSSSSWRATAESSARPFGFAGAGLAAGASAAPGRITHAVATALMGRPADVDASVVGFVVDLPSELLAKKTELCGVNGGAVKGGPGALRRRIPRLPQGP